MVLGVPISSLRSNQKSQVVSVPELKSKLYGKSENLWSTQLIKILFSLIKCHLVEIADYSVIIIDLPCLDCTFLTNSYLFENHLWGGKCEIFNFKMITLHKPQSQLSDKIWENKVVLRSEIWT